MCQSETLKQVFENAVEGLLYPSESDEPFEYVCLASEAEALNAARLLALLGLPSATPVEAQSLDDFFADLTEAQAWWGDKEKADAEKYQALRQLLQDRLELAWVFRVGEVEVEVYVLGRHGSDWVGVRTLSVET